MSMSWKPTRSFGAALQNHRGPGVTEGQARETRVHRTFDLLLGGLGQVGDVLAADHHGAMYQARLQVGVGDVDARPHAGAGVADVERDRVGQAAPVAQPRGRAGLEDELVLGSVAAGDVARDDQIDVVGLVARAGQAVVHRLPGEVDRVLARVRPPACS